MTIMVLSTGYLKDNYKHEYDYDYCTVDDFNDNYNLDLLLITGVFNGIGAVIISLGIVSYLFCKKAENKNKGGG